jgi:hypothetical protein
MATYGPGDKCPTSGQWAILEPDLTPTGVERTVTRGEPFPPTPKAGQRYRLVDATRH